VCFVAFTLEKVAKVPRRRPIKRLKRRFLLSCGLSFEGMLVHVVVPNKVHSSESPDLPLALYCRDVGNHAKVYYQL